MISNICGHNNNVLAKNMTIQLMKLMKIKEKHKEVHLIIGGDLNDAADDLLDRMPARIPSNSKFKIISYLLILILQS